MTREMTDDDMACRGGTTRPYSGMGCAEMQQCVACKKAVRWDLTEHPFFGFQTCKHAKKLELTTSPAGDQP